MNCIPPNRAPIGTEAGLAAFPPALIANAFRGEL